MTKLVSWLKNFAPFFRIVWNGVFFQTMVQQRWKWLLKCLCNGDSKMDKKNGRELLRLRMPTTATPLGRLQLAGFRDL